MVGPQGAVGPQGIQGVPGANAVIGLTYPSATFSNPALTQYGVSGVNFGQVPCAAGKKVAGGGVHTSLSGQAVGETYPTDGVSAAPGQAGWGATVKNFSGVDGTFTVYAICSNP